jgi:CheY-like chemotaxis protein
VCTVLVVEDDSELREILTSVLEREGHQVLQASNGREALEVLRSNEPALVLLDLMMPVMSGPELLEVMLSDARLRRVPVVVVSAISAEMPSIVKQSLQKPVSASALREAVKHHAAVR